MITLKSTTKFVDSSESSLPSIMKKKVIVYPSPKPSDSRISSKEYNKLLEKKKKYDEAKEAQDTINEVAAFERKLYGKTKVTSSPKLEALDKRQMDTLAAFSEPEEAKIFETPTLTNIQMSPSLEGFQLRQTTWSTVDQPEMLTRKTISRASVRSHSAPFSTHTKISYDNGIPLLQKDLISKHKYKMQQFAAATRYRMSIDNQKIDTRHKNAFLKNQEMLRNRRESQTRLCARIGQGWATRKLQGPPPPPKQVYKPTEDEIEAMKSFHKHDQAMLEEEKAAKIEEKKAIQTRFEGVRMPSVLFGTSPNFHVTPSGILCK